MTLESTLSTLIPSTPPSTGAPNSLPNIVLLATTPTQETAYTHVSGHTSLAPSLAKPVSPNSLFWIASCTKLLTSLCVLQLVERGQTRLDQPVGDILPELANPDILEGWNSDGTPILRKATRKIEVRHLLTHTSGLAYSFLSEETTKWFAHKKIEQKDIEGDVVRSYSSPLLFEPGSKWMYSPGLDWAGILVARVSGEIDLQEYMRKHLWGPLGIRGGDMAFRKRDLGLGEQEVGERWVHASLRKQGDGSLVPLQEGWRDFNPRDALGGGGIVASPEAYLKVLGSLLRNDGLILGKSTLDEFMLQPMLVEGKIGIGAYEGLIGVLDSMVGARMLTGGLPLPKEEGSHEYQHGLLGLLSREKGQNGGEQKQWTLSWGGLPNLFWHVDREEGVAGIMATQVIPPGDPKCMEIAVMFREEMARRFGRKSGSGASGGGGSGNKLEFNKDAKEGKKGTIEGEMKATGEKLTEMIKKGT